MIRRYGEPVKPGQRYRRRPGVYAVLLRGDSILTTFQQAPVPEFQLPGGGIDATGQPADHRVAGTRQPAGQLPGDLAAVGGRMPGADDRHGEAVDSNWPSVK